MPELTPLQRKFRFPVGRTPKVVARMRDGLNLAVMTLAHRFHDFTEQDYGSRAYVLCKDKLLVLTPIYLKHITLDTQRDIAKLRARADAGVTNILQIIQAASRDAEPQQQSSSAAAASITAAPIIDATIIPSENSSATPSDPHGPAGENVS